uniref:Uncharacterized protein n=1 Tax=Ananas comosus var. bracteatus TaxID=296719 RepID=A0A6V7PNZ3_ANACO|nr:unnamed protein product [Ananas comosus var. bracteatus]
MIVDGAPADGREKICLGHFIEQVIDRMHTIRGCSFGDSSTSGHLYIRLGPVMTTELEVATVFDVEVVAAPKVGAVLVANPRPIEMNQNGSFVVSVVLIALVRSVHKSDRRICRDCTLIEERSVMAKR